MKLYFAVIKFNLLRYLAYPHEIIAVIARRIMEVMLILVFWVAIAESSGGKFDAKSLIAYFLLAFSISEITLTNYLPFGRDINVAIKQGRLNNFLIKPVKLIPFMYSDFMGRSGARIILSVLLFFVSLVLLPPASFLSFILFWFALFAAILIALSFNIFIGVISFYTTEANSFKNAISHINRVLSGLLIPITFFPPLLRKISMVLPFQAMVFGPANMLRQEFINKEVLFYLAINLIWGIGLISLAIYYWKKGLKKYEAVGI